jgi:hypothetical protein
MALKRFAQILGVVLILVGLVGLVLGDRVWLGILNVDIVEDIVHLATGGLLAYVRRPGRWRDSASWTFVPRPPSWVSRWRWSQRYCGMLRPREGVRSCSSWPSGWSRLGTWCT